MNGNIGLDHHDSFMNGDFLNVDNSSKPGSAITLDCNSIPGVEEEIFTNLKHTLTLSSFKKLISDSKLLFDRLDEPERREAASFVTQTYAINGASESGVQIQPDVQSLLKIKLETESEKKERFSNKETEDDQDFIDDSDLNDNSVKKEEDTDDDYEDDNDNYDDDIYEDEEFDSYESPKKESRKKRKRKRSEHDPNDPITTEEGEEIFKTLVREIKANSKSVVIDGKRKNVCHICQESYGQGEIAQHIGRKHFTTRYKCPHCDTSKGYRALIKRHILVEHSGDPSARTYKDSKHCDLCGKFVAHYVSHFKRVHEKIKNVHCQHCGKGFFDNKDLETHIIKIHEPPRKEICGHCGISVVNLQRHIDTVHEKKVERKICPECGNTFSKYDIKDHIRAVHEKLRPFNCHLCPYEAFKRDSLKKHLLTHEKHAAQNKEYKPVKRHVYDDKNWDVAMQSALQGKMSIRNAAKVYNVSLDRLTKACAKKRKEQEEAANESLKGVEESENIQGTKFPPQPQQHQQLQQPQYLPREIINPSLDMKREESKTESPKYHNWNHQHLHEMALAMKREESKVEMTKYQPGYQHIQEMANYLSSTYPGVSQ